MKPSDFQLSQQMCSMLMGARIMSREFWITQPLNSTNKDMMVIARLIWVSSLSSLMVWALQHWQPHYLMLHSSMEGGFFACERLSTNDWSKHFFNCQRLTPPKNVFAEEFGNRQKHHCKISLMMSTQGWWRKTMTLSLNGGFTHSWHWWLGLPWLLVKALTDNCSFHTGESYLQFLWLCSSPSLLVWLQLPQTRYTIQRWDFGLSFIHAQPNCGIFVYQPGLNVITEMILGYIYPGKPLANLAFKTYGSVSMGQAIMFLSDFKLGHYMKIPPKSMFVVQVITKLQT